MLSKRITIRLTGVFLSLFILMAVTSVASAKVYYLWADKTTVTMPDATVVPVWGFGVDGDNNFSTLDYTVTVPGQTLTVNPGDGTLRVVLKNMLPEPVSLHILGQRPGVGMLGGVWTDFPAETRTFNNRRPAFNYKARVRSFTKEAGANGGTATYTWFNLKPGTYMLQSGTNPAKQVQMGLFAPVKKDSGLGEAYTGVGYDKELVIAVHEIDPAIHGAIAAGTYGNVAGATITSSVKYDPKYFLINGKAFPAAELDPINAATVINVGDRVLLRFVNGGLQTYNPQLQGPYMTFWAEDGIKLTYSMEQYHFELPPAKTMDAIVTFTRTGDFVLYDGGLNLSNAGSVGGGMMAKIRVQ